MEQGRLFSRAEKTVPVYRKEYSFAEDQKSAFWDREEHGIVTHGEALAYDEIMRKIIAPKFN